MKNYFRQTLEKLCGQPGVSEYEAESGITDAILSMAKEINPQTSIDGSGNVISVVGSGKRTIILEAHMDEIGFVVEKVNGVATLSTRGIVKEEKIADSNAYVVGKDIAGIIKKKEDDGDFVFVPTDASKKALIQSGDIVALKRSFMQNGDLVTAGALDNRLGCATLLTVLRKAMESQLGENKLVFVFSTKEEVDASSFNEVITTYGGDFAIVVDAAYAQPVDFDINAPGVAIPIIGNGCAIQTSGKGFAIKEETIAIVERLAEENNIRTQRESAPQGLGKTNFTQMLAEGVREGAVINIPAKNQHNETGEASLFDAQEAVRLIEVIIDFEIKKNS